MHLQLYRVYCSPLSVAALLYLRTASLCTYLLFIGVGEHQLVGGSRVLCDPACMYRVRQ